MKAADIELECEYCGETFKVRPDKWYRKFCGRSCSWKNLHEDWPSLHREISEDRGYRPNREDEGDGE